VVEGIIQRRQKMRNIQEMIDELRALKRRQIDVCTELADEVLKYPGIQDALKDGLVKLNFPAPPGFNRYLKNNYR